MYFFNIRYKDRIKPLNPRGCGNIDQIRAGKSQRISNPKGKIDDLLSQDPTTKISALNSNEE
jgi:hypothetical protein